MLGFNISKRYQIVYYCHGKKHRPIHAICVVANFGFPFVFYLFFPYCYEIIDIIKAFINCLYFFDDKWAITLDIGLPLVIRWLSVIKLLSFYHVRPLKSPFPDTNFKKRISWIVRAHFPFREKSYSNELSQRWKWRSFPGFY